MSWKPAWKIAGEPGDKWCMNAQAFATRAEAEASAHARFQRWTLTTDWSAQESDDPINYRWLAGDVPIDKRPAMAEGSAT